MIEPPDHHKIRLKKVLGTTQLWAIAVGMVISGQYFGWNYGWGVAGTTSFLVSVLLVTVLYLTFIFFLYRTYNINSRSRRAIRLRFPCDRPSWWLHCWFCHIG
jgi:hypothetical protein